MRKHIYVIASDIISSSQQHLDTQELSEKLKYIPRFWHKLSSFRQNQAAILQT